MERSSRWATRAAGRRTRTASRLSAGFPKLWFWFQTSGAWKKLQFKTHPWNSEKCKRLPKGRLRNRENVECIEMYIGMYRTKKTELYMYNSKKMELYMYNSKKTELYMYNPKKWSYTCITRKKIELHILIHSYTSHLFRRFWGRGFWKSIVCLAFVWPKKCGPMGRDCWN